MDGEQPALDARHRSELIERLVEKLRERYIYPDVATAMEESIRRRVGSGEYDAISEGKQFCEVVTAHLQEVSQDKHLHLFYSAEGHPLRETGEPTPQEIADFQEWGRLHNFGFARVERLPGNIGYLDLRTFFTPELEGAGATAIAAMNFLAHTSALIIDLRENGGGSPSMVVLITSYLFDKRFHLTSFFWRAGERIEQFWTLPYVPGKRFVDKSVYVLTSERTFSAAEDFSYNLKHLKRATIVGEPTGGGAHPGGTVPLDAHFAVWLPTGRSINAVTNTNWEGAGVQPDIMVPAEEALKTTHILALKQILAQSGDNPGAPLQELIAEVRRTLEKLEEAQGTAVDEEQAAS
jgi:retinol-binding protein 3